MKNKELNSEELKRIEKQISLLEKRIEEIKIMKENAGIEVNDDDLAKQVKINWLGKMKLINEVGELADKDIYCIFELVNGKLEMRYYDEDENLLGTKEQLYAHISIEDELASVLEDDEKKEKEQERVQHELEEMDEEEALRGAKNREALTKEQERLKEEEKQEEKAKELQLTPEQLRTLSGPKINLGQHVDDVTLGNKIGLQGKYIQFVDINTVKELMPDLEIDELGQQFIPIEIFLDGTANVISEDKLEFSTAQGSNSTIDQTTINNDGTVTHEQSIVTFNIKGTNNALAISWDDEGGTGSPFYEVSYGTINAERGTDIYKNELETEHQGPLKADDKTHTERRKNTEGIYEASEEIVTVEQAERYMNAMNKIEGNETITIEEATAILKDLSKGSQGKKINEIVKSVEEEAQGDEESEQGGLPAGPWERTRDPRRW